MFLFYFLLNKFGKIIYNNRSWKSEVGEWMAETVTVGASNARPLGINVEVGS